MEFWKGAHSRERGALCRNFVVNAPGFFSLVWRIAEPMLSPSTRKKIRLLHNKQVCAALVAFSGCCLWLLLQEAHGALPFQAFKLQSA